MRLIPRNLPMWARDEPRAAQLSGDTRNRDGLLSDEGRITFPETVREVHKGLPLARVEVLTPDSAAIWMPVARVLDDAGPHVFNHNMETVRDVLARAGPQARLIASLEMGSWRLRAAIPRFDEIRFWRGWGEDRRTKSASLLRRPARLRYGRRHHRTYLQPTSRNLPSRLSSCGAVRRWRISDVRSVNVSAGPRSKSYLMADEVSEEARARCAEWTPWRWLRRRSFLVFPVFRCRLARPGGLAPMLVVLGTGTPSVRRLSAVIWSAGIVYWFGGLIGYSRWHSTAAWAMPPVGRSSRYSPG